MFKNLKNIEIMSTKNTLIQKTSRGGIVLFINLMTFSLFFLRDILASRFFGINRELDSIYLAIMVPSLATNFMFQPLSDFLIPKYQARLENQANILHLYLNTIIYIFIASLLVGGILFLGSNEIANILAPGFDLAGKEVVSSYIRFSIPIVIFGGLIVVSNVLLNSVGKYMFSALASLSVPVIAILYVVSFSKTFGVKSFIEGMIIGQIINLLLVILFLVCFLKNKYDYRGIKILYPKRTIFLEYGSQNLANLCFYGINAIGASMGTHFQEGTTTLIILVNKFISFFSNLFNTTYTSVLMPYMSRLFLNSDRQFHKESRHFLFILSSLSLVAVLGIMFTADYLSELLFLSSKIASDQKQNFSRFIELGIFQIPFLMSLVFLFKFLTINSKFIPLAIVSTLTILENILLTYLLKDHFGSLSLLIAPYIVLLSASLSMMIYLVVKKMSFVKKDLMYLSLIWGIISFLFYFEALK